MVFCCFRSSPIVGSKRDEPAGKQFVEQNRSAVGNGSTGVDTNASQLPISNENATMPASCEQQPATASGSSPRTKSQQSSQDAVMRVVALLQELLGLTSERMQISRIMGLLCQRLSVSWACLTALSADGEVFQHIGAAYMLDSKPGTCSFSSCRTNSGLGQQARGPPSRSSSANSIAGMAAVEVSMSDPHPLRGSDTSIEATTCSGQPILLSDPLAAAAPLPTSCRPGAPPCGPSPQTPQQPPTFPVSGSPAGSGPGEPGGPHPLTHSSSAPPAQPAFQSASQSQAQYGARHSYDNHYPNNHAPPEDEAARPDAALPLSSWPLDWQLMYREKGLRAFACLPVTATNGSGTIIGCLSLASTEPLDWSRQFWAASTRLITGWAAGVITTTRATARASFYARLFSATDLDGLARAFAYDMPVFLSDGAAGPGTALPEVRLALVSSRLQHAVVYAAPLLQVSGRLGLPYLGGSGGAGGGGGFGLGHGVGQGLGGVGAGGGGGVVLIGGAAGGASVSGGSMAGLVLGSAFSAAPERIPPHGGGALPQGALRLRDGAGAGGGNRGTACGYDTMDCMVLGTTADIEEHVVSGRTSSNNSSGGNRRPPASSATDSSLAAGAPDRGRPGSSPQPEAPPVDCLRINTDSTLLMSVLEAGDIMIIKDALQYFGGGRMVARDLALNNTRPATAGTLVILPLVHRCRSLGCVYVFARNEFNLTFGRAAWGDLAGMLSRAVFAQLVGKLRHEWYAVLSEDLESHAAAQFRTGRLSNTGVGRRVRRTTTGNSLCSNASSLRPSFELPSRSMEQAAGGAAGAANREAAAAALAAAAEVLEYAGFILPDGPEEGPGEGPGGILPLASSKSGGMPSTPRHRIPPEHATVRVAAEGGEEGVVAEMGAAAAALAAEATDTATEGVTKSAGAAAVEVAAAEAAPVEAAAAPDASAGSEGNEPSFVTSGAAYERCSPSPGSLSFKLSPNLAKTALLPLLVEGGGGREQAGTLPNQDTLSLDAASTNAVEERLPPPPLPVQLPLANPDPQEQQRQQQRRPPLPPLPPAENRRSKEASEAGAGAGAGLPPVEQPQGPGGVNAEEVVLDVESLGLQVIQQDDKQQEDRAPGRGGLEPGSEGGLMSGHASGAVAKPVKVLQATAEGITAVSVTDAPGAGPSTLVAFSVTAGASGSPPAATTTVVETEGDEMEEVSGSSRELQGWPELVDILYEMHRTRNVSVYLAAYRGQAVAVKMFRSHLSMDGHLESEALTIAAQQQLSTVRHPNVLRILMVYPLVYEVVAGKPPAQRHGPPGAAAGTSFNTHNSTSPAGGGLGGGAGGSAAASAQAQLHAQSQAQLQGLAGLGLCGLGPGPLHVQAQAHAMGELLFGATLSEATGGGVYLTAVLPRREKFKRGLALMMELFPSLSLREAIQKRMLLPAADGGGGGLAGVHPGGDGAATTGTYCMSSQTMVSDMGYLNNPTSGGPHSSGGLTGAPSGACCGVTNGTAAAAAAAALAHPHGPHGPLSLLPTLPEALSANEGQAAYGLLNVDSSPGLAMTGTSNSGGPNTANLSGGPGGVPGGGASTPPVALLLSILSQIAAGMTALHSAGLAHGELRPENVLLALPSGGGPHSRTVSGQNDRTAADGTPRVSPTLTPRGCGMMSMSSTSAANGNSGVGGVGVGAGAGAIASGGGSNNGRVRSGSNWTLQSGVNGGGGAGGGEDRSSKPERPQPGRPITPDVIVKIKDAGMTVVGFSKGSQTVRKLLQRNRSAVLPFLPPEVHRGERFGRSADVYMFGILMWELYTGNVAFSNLSGTPIKLLQTIIADGVRPPWPDGTPVWYQSLASRCWSGNPRQRPSFRRIGDKLAEASTAAAMASAAAAVGWAGGGALQGVAEVL